jgi:hypothetical protein
MAKYTPKDEFSDDGMALTRTSTSGSVFVEWEDIGEGLDGDFDEADPDDVALLRFYVSRRVNGDWESVDDASYCTRMPVGTDKATLRAGLLSIMGSVFDGALSGSSVKRVAEGLSWMAPGKTPGEVAVPG